MHTSNYLYHDGEQELHGFLAHKTSKSRPAVLIAHDWTGRNEFACDKAKILAELGYVAFAIDMYGMGRIGKSTTEKMALMEPLANDRLLLRRRVNSAYDAIVGMPEVDINRIAIIGFCFGGMCALDLARSGADLKGVISFHGLLTKPNDIPNQKINAQILILHGYDDPMVPPEQVNNFCVEMTAAHVDWQLHAYSHTKHAFMNPEAHDEKLGTIFNEKTATRAWEQATNFLHNIFD